MALATSSKETETFIKLKAFEIDHKFSSIKCFEDVKNPKPHPEIYLNSANALNLLPEECIAFEDTCMGIKAAKAAGCYTIAIPNNFTTHLDFSEADQVFTTFNEAIAFVKNDLLD